MDDYIKYEVEVYSNGTKHWYLNGKLHREDGPAVDRIDDYKSWHLNGELHREDGPAIEWANGEKSWWLNDCPLTEEEFNESMARTVIEYTNGYKHWYLNDCRITEQDFNTTMSPSIEMTMAQINEALGKNVKVIDDINKHGVKDYE